jgi:hypothetical protein
MLSTKQTSSPLFQISMAHTGAAFQASFSPSALPSSAYWLEVGPPLPAQLLAFAPLLRAGKRDPLLLRFA